MGAPLAGIFRGTLDAARVFSLFRPSQAKRQAKSGQRNRVRWREVWVRVRLTSATLQSALPMVIEVSMVIEGEEPLAFPHLKARAVVALSKKPLRSGDSLVVIGARYHLDFAKAALSIQQIAPISVHPTSLSNTVLPTSKAITTCIGAHQMNIKEMYLRITASRWTPPQARKRTGAALVRFSRLSAKCRSLGAQP